MLKLAVEPSFGRGHVAKYFHWDRARGNPGDRRPEPLLKRARKDERAAGAIRFEVLAVAVDPVDDASTLRRGDPADGACVDDDPVELSTTRPFGHLVDVTLPLQIVAKPVIRHPHQGFLRFVEDDLAHDPHRQSTRAGPIVYNV